MRLLLTAAMLAVLRSCPGEVPPAPTATPPPTPAVAVAPSPIVVNHDHTVRVLHPSVSQLRVEMKKRSLHFYIWCSAYYEGDPEEYCAWASSTPWHVKYVEDGAKPAWIQCEFKSRKQAIAWLLQAVDSGPPTSEPRSKRTEKRKRAEKCPPPIEG